MMAVDGASRIDYRRPQPTLARVVVNRIWMHHFGQGWLTPNDFGVSGGS